MNVDDIKNFFSKISPISWTVNFLLNRANLANDTLKQKYPDTKAWMISSNMDAIKRVGLRTSRKIKLFNGKLESKLLMYSIYKGTKKQHKHNREEL